jgi:hypothetical protein
MLAQLVNHFKRSESSRATNESIERVIVPRVFCPGLVGDMCGLWLTGCLRGLLQPCDLWPLYLLGSLWLNGLHLHCGGHNGHVWFGLCVAFGHQKPMVVAK